MSTVLIENIITENRWLVYRTQGTIGTVPRYYADTTPYRTVNHSTVSAKPLMLCVNAFPLRRPLALPSPLGYNHAGHHHRNRRHVPKVQSVEQQRLPHSP